MPARPDVHDVLVVEVDGDRCALPVEEVVEVVRDLDVLPLVGAPAAVLGLANVRGAVLPVLDLPLLAGFSPLGAAPYALVVEVDGHAAALAVPAVPAPAPLGAAMEPADRPGVSGRHRLGEAGGAATAVLVDVPALVGLVRAGAA